MRGSGFLCIGGRGHLEACGELVWGDYEPFEVVGEVQRGTDTTSMLATSV